MRRRVATGRRGVLDRAQLQPPPALLRAQPPHVLAPVTLDSTCSAGTSVPTFGVCVPWPLAAAGTSRLTATQHLRQRPPVSFLLLPTKLENRWRVTSPGRVECASEVDGPGKSHEASTSDRTGTAAPLVVGRDEGLTLALPCESRPGLGEPGRLFRRKAKRVDESFPAHKCRAWGVDHQSERDVLQSQRSF
jgi:hypothetical protein